MQKKRFLFVSSGMLAVLTLFVMFRYRVWIDEDEQIISGILLVLSIAATVFGWVWLRNNNNAVILYCAVGICALTQILHECMMFVEYPYGNVTELIVAMIASGVMLALCFVGAFTIKNSRVETDKYCMFGVCVALGALFSSSWVSYLGIGLIQLTMAFALAVYLLHCLNKLTPLVSHVIVGVCFAFVAVANGLCIMRYGNYLDWFILIAVVLLSAAYYVVYFAFVRNGKPLVEDDRSGGQKPVMSLEEKIKRLSELNQLKEEGILTEEEYNIQKHKIMEDK